ncbi:MAG: DNA-binding protein [Pyrinomonadaceae bacterium]
MNRNDFKKLTNLRVKEAKVLLDNKCYEGAYYLLGYAVECAFKACIAKQTRRYDFPDKNFASKIYTHDITTLLESSGLKPERDKKSKVNPKFEVNWAIVKDWSEKNRYSMQIDEQTAEAFHSAVLNRKDGILSWLRKWW